MIGRSTANGAIIMAGSRLLTRLIDLVVLLVTARLLTPADFGVVAIAMTLVHVVEAVLELPVAQALLRQPRLGQSHLDTAFTLGLLRGGVLALILWAACIPFAWFYGDDRLALLTAALALAPVFRGLASPAMVAYLRAQAFGQEALLDIAGKAASLVCAVSIALMGGSYWALAAATITTPAVSAALSYLFAPYRPRISFRRWPVFRPFVGWILPSQIIAALSWQIDRLILGKVVSAADLGRYTAANDMSQIPFQAFITPLLRPLMAAFALVADDAARLRAAYLKSVSALVTVVLPMLVGISLVAERAVPLVLGRQWVHAGPLLAGLALTFVPALFVAPVAAAAMGLGRPRLVMIQNAAVLAIKAPLVLAGAVAGGVVGVVVARGAAELLIMLAGLALISRTIGLPVWRQIWACRRPVAAAAAMAAFVHWSPVLAPLWRRQDDIVGLAALIPAAAAVYGLVLLAAWLLEGRPDGIEKMAADRLEPVSRWLRPRPGAAL